MDVPKSIGALGYLEDEKSRDDKGFIAKDKNLDQRQLNPELLGYLERGQKFNKNELCHTYAEYFVFAAMLAVNVCLMEDGTGEYAKEIMKGMWYSYTDEEGVEHQLDAVEGYCHIFERHLLTEDAEKACAMMREKCR